jgi:hypothetical protein
MTSEDENRGATGHVPLYSDRALARGIQEEVTLADNAYWFAVVLGLASGVRSLRMTESATVHGEQIKN